MKKLIAALAMCALLGACTPKEEKADPAKDAKSEANKAATSQPSGDLPPADDKKKADDHK